MKPLTTFKKAGIVLNNAGRKSITYSNSIPDQPYAALVISSSILQRVQIFYNRLA